MRYFPILLSAGVALVSIPAAAAVSGNASRDAFVVGASCPKMEGYPDCHPDADAGSATYSRNRFRIRA
jgi:hypothetical protein